jgi:hypothetical protein
MTHARFSNAPLLAIGALVLQGCIGSETYYVDERFSAEEQQRIREAASMWEEATGGSVHFDLVFGQRVDVADSDRKVIVKTSARAAFNRFPEMVSDTRVALYHEGSTFQASQIVVIAERVELDMLRPTMAHEMGHAFGLRHVPEAEALMYENLNNDPTKCVTEDDLREARRFVQVAADQPCGKGLH